MEFPESAACGVFNAANWKRFRKHPHEKRAARSTGAAMKEI